MLTVKEAQEVSGVRAGQLLLLALTQRIPSQKDPDSRLILFEPAAIQELCRINGRNLRTHPPTRQ